jgi:hypothetical protein
MRLSDSSDDTSTKCTIICWRNLYFEYLAGRRYTPWPDWCALLIWALVRYRHVVLNSRGLEVFATVSTSSSSDSSTGPRCCGRFLSLWWPPRWMWDAHLKFEHEVLICNFDIRIEVGVGLRIQGRNRIPSLTEIHLPSWCDFRGHLTWQSWRSYISSEAVIPFSVVKHLLRSEMKLDHQTTKFCQMLYLHSSSSGRLPNAIQNQTR